MRWLSVTSERVQARSRRQSGRPRTGFWLALLPLLLLAACAGRRELPPSEPRGVYKLGQPYQVNGRWYVPEFDPNYDRIGIASWYGEEFHGRPTANGERFDRTTISAAHPTLPLPSLVEVTNLDNGRRLVVRVNDRGPFVDDRLIDLSEAAARELGFRDRGLARVRVRFLRLAEDARGVPPSPRSPQPPAEQSRLAAREPAPCAGGDRYLIQIGAFRDPARARRAAATLERFGPVRMERADAAPLLRVQLGPLANASDALALLERARALGYRQAFVVTERRTTGCSPQPAGVEMS
jgi:rare lipoprotein A